MNGLWQDIRFGLRMLRRAPMHSLLCIAVLAMGIALVAMQYALVEATLLKPLRYDPQGRLYTMWHVHPLTGDQPGLMEPEALWMEKAQKSFEWVSVTPDQLSTWNELRNGENWTWVSSTWVTPGQMEHLGLTPAMGRGFAPEDFQVGAAAVLMLTDRCWKEDFAGREDIVGFRVSIGGADHTIIGVTAPGAYYPGNNSVWRPYHRDPTADPKQMTVTGRLKPDVSATALAEEMSRLSSQYNQEKSVKEGDATRWHARPLREVLVGDDRGMLLMMLLAVVLVLIMTCANVANLLLVKAMRRSKELALRSVLGATRGRIIRQMLIEALVLAMLGAAAGLALARSGLEAARPYWDWMVPSWAAPEVNLPVMLSVAGMMAVAALLTGLVPAWRASRVHVNEMLKEDTRTASGRKLGWLSRASVVVQVALSVGLLVVAGTCISQIRRITHHELPFDPRQVLVARVAYPQEAYSSAQVMRRECRKLEQACANTPDLPRFALTTRMNMRRPEPGAGAQVPGHPAVPAIDGKFNCRFSFIGAGYFAAMGVPLLAGREFNDMDTADSEPVTIIDRPFAERFFPGENPIGQIVESGPNKMRVIGVVPTLYLGGLKPDDSGIPGFYRPLAVTSPSGIWVMADSGTNPTARIAALRKAVKEYDPQAPPPDIETVQQSIERGMWYQTSIATLFGIFSAVALVLAMTGTYGVLAFAVGQRTREMGIRMALGASPLGIVRLVMMQGARQVAIGLALGLVLGWGLLRVLGSVVGGVYPEPAVYGSVAGLLALTGMLAMLAPAWRAARVEPAISLRAE